jgi:hypothetical protein
MYRDDDYNDDDVLWFSKWRKAQGYYSYAKARDIVLSSGYSEKRLDRQWQKIVDEFWDYCDKHGYEGEMDE